MIGESVPQGQWMISAIEPHPIEENTPEEGDQQLWRLYVGNRNYWRYVIVDGRQALLVYHAFHSVRLLTVGLPEDIAFHVQPRETRDESREFATEMYHVTAALMKELEATQ